MSYRVHKGYSCDLPTNLLAFTIVTSRDFLEQGYDIANFSANR